VRAWPVLVAFSLAACASVPVDPSDAVKTEAEAIALGRKACGDDSIAERNIKYARLQTDGIWLVWGPTGRRYQDAFMAVSINKRDGSIAQECDISS
jgi:hypothetical protein